MIFFLLFVNDFLVQLQVKNEILIPFPMNIFPFIIDFTILFQYKIIHSINIEDKNVSFLRLIK